MPKIAQNPPARFFSLTLTFFVKLIQHHDNYSSIVKDKAQPKPIR